MYMNQGDTVQIEAPDFDPDIDRDTSLSTDKKPNEVTIQVTLPPIPEVTEPEDDNSFTPGTTTQQLTSQETDWPDAIPMQIPRVSSSTAQPEEQGHNRRQAQYNTENFEIPELEENSEEEQFADLNSYMSHHNTYQASQHIQQEYHSQNYKNWMTINITPRLTGCIILRIHRLHRTISWQTSKQNHKDLQKSLKEYLAEAEVKPGEKSYTFIDHLAQELIPYKVTSSARSRRISAYAKGMLIT